MAAPPPPSGPMPEMGASMPTHERNRIARASVAVGRASAPPPPPPMGLMRQMTSTVLEGMAGAASPGRLMSMASSTVTAAPRAIGRRMSSVVDTAGALKEAVLPTHEVGLDVLGLMDPNTPSSPGGGPPTLMKKMSTFAEDDLFEVDAMDADGNVSPMVAGVGLTSLVLREGTGPSDALDWAAELLLLTHEPMRRDMLEMQRALNPRYFGELPEGWRVRAFFRFFTGWSALTSQQHAVEVAVHYDWLVAPTGKMSGEHRSELLSYHRAIELELLAISRLEQKTMEELSSELHEPWSECAEMLRERFNKLCAMIRLHLATQESTLPEILREHWGRVSPPELVERSLKAAKGAQAAASKGKDKPKLLNWCLHYLEKRDPSRAKALRGQLPFMKRCQLALGVSVGTMHAEMLENIRAIILDEASVVPKLREDEQGGGASSRGSLSEGSQRGEVVPEREAQRRAGMVNAVLAAANARRVDVPISQDPTMHKMAASEKPLHQFKMDGAWTAKSDAKVPDNLYKRIGVDEPKAPPRRL